MDTDTVIHIKANIDDLSGEEHGFLMARLLELGALDVNFSPLMMKKNRPAVLLSVLVKKELARETIDFLMSQGASLGLRVKEEFRVKAKREIKTVLVDGIKVRIKESFWNGELVKYKVEYDDCKSLANAKEISYDQARQLVIDKYLN